MRHSRGLLLWVASTALCGAGALLLAAGSSSWLRWSGWIALDLGLFGALTVPLLAVLAPPPSERDRFHDDDSHHDAFRSGRPS